MITMCSFGNLAFGWAGPGTDLQIVLALEYGPCALPVPVVPERMRAGLPTRRLSKLQLTNLQTQVFHWLAADPASAQTLAARFLQNRRLDEAVRLLKRLQRLGIVEVVGGRTKRRIWGVTAEGRRVLREEWILP